jgi:potassium channel subfamily K, other eukaryote
VFWALIALPTLTVLIGAIGDAVSSFVNWYTDWIGNHSMSIIKLGKAFFATEHRAERIKNAAKKVARDHEKQSANGLGESDADNGFQEIAEIERQRTVPLDFEMDGLTAMEAAVAEETYKPFIILKAAQHIMEHLDASPPRKYSFKEWTWLLKLLGEDETDEKGHRRVGQELSEGQEVVTPIRTENKHVWSWLGQESPLMSLEEGECILSI